MPLTGLVLPSSTPTAKGGAVFPIFRELGIPIKLIGVGERAEDLHEFDRGEFVEALF